jgi:hypothetical protein
MQPLRRALGLASLIILIAALPPAIAQRGDDSERLSKNGKTAGAIDGIEISLEFGRPGVKNRKLWGGLVPYDRIWRTGADEATTISLAADALVEGEPLAAGTYSLFTIPGESEWTVVFNTVAEQWGAFNYDKGKDALRVTVTPRSSEFVENLEFEIEGTEVVLRWGELALPIAVAAQP